MLNYVSNLRDRVSDTTRSTPPGRPPASPLFYSGLVIVVAIVAVGVVSASWLASRPTAVVGPFPPVPPVARGPSDLRVVVTAVEGMYNYSNGSTNGWLGVSPSPLNISASEPGAPPYTFVGGQYLDWEARLTNLGPNDTWINGIYLSTPGVHFFGTGEGSYFTFSPHQSLDIDLEFQLPYENYTGPLTFDFGAY